MIYSQIKTPTSTANSYYGWSNLGNVLLNDGSLAASPVVNHNSPAPYLRLNNCNGNLIPLNATIVGVIARIEAKNQYSGTGFHCMGTSPVTGPGGLQLLGTTGTTGKGMTAFTSNTLSIKTVGGDADLWGATEITPEQVNDPAFGLYALFRNLNTTPQKMFIDHIQLEVFYTLPDPDQPIGGNGPVKPE